MGINDPNFSAAILPFIGDNLFELWLFNTLGDPYLVSDAISAGDVLDFGPTGVDMFRILGIETGVFLDPSDPTAFVTQVSFVDSGQFTGTMTPITQFVEGQVPTPATLTLFGFGLAGLGWSRRNKA